VELLARGRLYRRDLEVQARHARDLVPAMASLLTEASLPPRELTRIIVSIGPGSYTGLRVGITAAKVYAFATGARLHAVPTFELWRLVLPGNRRHVCVSDALKGTVFVQRETAGEVTIEPWADVRAKLQTGETLVGDEKLRAEASPESWLTIQELSQHAWRWACPDLDGLEPLYLRGSSAEELKKAKQVTSSATPA
jgi:tRNA threonylcarbamoyladenosine biosynthesis protein TsaB